MGNWSRNNGAAIVHLSLGAELCHYFPSYLLQGRNITVNICNRDKMSLLTTLSKCDLGDLGKVLNPGDDEY